jgi:aspartate aminotransferase
VHVSDPTWGNHVPLLGSSGLALESYPYYDSASHRLLFDAMLERLERAAPGDVVLVHGCCHNPSGADLDMAQWRALSQLLTRRRLVPFLDLAYQGFGEDLEADAAGVRLVAEQAPEALIAVSFSKNLGLYRERVGALIAIGENPSRADAISSHVLQIARSIYSMPPDHGAAIAAHVLTDAALRSGWIEELDGMRSRIFAMRALLAQALRSKSGGDGFDFIGTQRGMFSLLGVSPQVVDRLRDRHHVFMLQDSRINLAGIMPHNADYVAAAIVRELG